MSLATQEPTFTESLGLIKKALKVVESVMPSAREKGHQGRQRKPINCENHLNDAFSRLQQLHDELTCVRKVNECDAKYQAYVDYVDRASQSLTSEMNKFVEYVKEKKKDYSAQQLCRFTSLFCHLTEEVKYLFPRGILSTDQIFGKKSVQKWWSDNFKSRVVVSRGEFSLQILKEFPVLREWTDAFLETICFSSSNYVSKYDLDIFTRLFWPWSHLVQVWSSLVGHPGYQKHGTFSTTIEALNAHRTKPGSYVFRISMSCSGYWSIGYVASDGKIVQVLCFGLPIIDYLCYGRQQGLYKFPNGKVLECDLSALCNLRTEVAVSEYGNDDADVMICKICEVDRKDIQLEPCGHLVCRQCCMKIQREAVTHGRDPLCHQCKSKILSTSLVEIKICKSTPVGNPTLEAGEADRPACAQDCHYESPYDVACHYINAPVPIQPAPPKHDMAWAVQEVASVCDRDRNEIETNIRLLHSLNSSLEEITNALKTTRGDRIKAAEYLKQRMNPEQ